MKNLFVIHQGDKLMSSIWKDVAYDEIKAHHICARLNAPLTRTKKKLETINIAMFNALKKNQEVKCLLSQKYLSKVLEMIPSLSFIEFREFVQDLYINTVLEKTQPYYKVTCFNKKMI